MNVQCSIHCLRQNLNMLIIIILTACFPRIRCQMRRKRKCWENGGWVSEMKLGQCEEEARQGWLGLRTHVNLRTQHKGTWLRGQWELKSHLNPTP